jgi:DNA-binding MarR family transcriptional regulator
MMPAPRTEILKELDKTLRMVGAQSVLLSDTVAKIVGLNSTDLECLDLLDIAGPTTAGRLAQHAGLTTGAMTAVIDRLERAGFVRRVRDPQDRRCVRVEALRRNFKHVTALYQRLIDATARLHQDYDDRQLAFVVDYLTKALALAADHVAWLQTQRPIRTPARAQRRRRKRQIRGLLPAGAAGGDGSLRSRP